MLSACALLSLPVPPVLAARPCARFPGPQHGLGKPGVQRFWSGLETRILSCAPEAPWKAMEALQNTTQLLKTPWQVWKTRVRSGFAQKRPGNSRFEHPDLWFCRNKGFQARKRCKTRGFEHFECMRGLETRVLSRFAQKMAWKHGF